MADICRGADRIVRPGTNCMAVAQARRAAVLVDGQAYFSALEQCLQRAVRSIFIIGWDFDAAIRLCPDRSDEQLGALLRRAVEANPDLEVRILVWSLAVVHAPGATLPLLLGADWDQHARISVRLDHRHPIYAAHHQKIVCIDDAIAFVGGMDLTVGRWDTARHLASDPNRTNPDGSRYEPVHDVQMMLDGSAAKAVSSIARERWRCATGEGVAPAECSGQEWPQDVAADFESVRLAVARTAPAWGDSASACEGIELALDALRTARRFIYMETQYFASQRIGEVLQELLARERGPEIIVVTTLTSRGLLERAVMGNNRDRLVRRLMRADRFGRFRIYYPVVPGGAGETEVKIHSKLMLVDDHFLRLGSSNLNNRSEGLDTECDVGIEAETEAERRAIMAVRNRLLAEHLGVEPHVLAHSLRDEGSLIGAIERLNTHPRGFRRPAASKERGPDRPVMGTRFLDPACPLEPAWLLRRKV